MVGDDSLNVDWNSKYSQPPSNLRFGLEEVKKDLEVRMMYCKDLEVRMMYCKATLSYDDF
jgi:hypothetical protein